MTCSSKILSPFCIKSISKPKKWATSEGLTSCEDPQCSHFGHWLQIKAPKYLHKNERLEIFYSSPSMFRIYRQWCLNMHLVRPSNILSIKTVDNPFFISFTEGIYPSRKKGDYFAQHEIVYIIQTTRYTPQQPFLLALLRQRWFHLRWAEAALHATKPLRYSQYTIWSPRSSLQPLRTVVSYYLKYCLKICSQSIGHAVITTYMLFMLHILQGESLNTDGWLRKLAKNYCIPTNRFSPLKWFKHGQQAIVNP